MQLNRIPAARPRPRGLPKMVMCPLTGELVEDTLLNRLLGNVGTYWGAAFGAVVALTLAVVALNLFGVTQ